VSHTSHVLQPAPGPVVPGLELYERTLGANQPEYVPLRALCSTKPDGAVLTRFTLTAEQRQVVRDGGDIFLEMLTFGHHFQPVLLRVAKEVNAESVIEYLALDGGVVPVTLETPIPGCQ
jgi:hypothetical protein